MNEKEKSMNQAVEYSETTQSKLFTQHHQLRAINLGMICLSILLLIFAFFFNTYFFKYSRIIRFIGFLSLISPLLGVIITSLSSYFTIPKINYDLSMSRQLLDNNDVILFSSKRLKILNEDIISLDKYIKHLKSTIRTSLICLISFFGILTLQLIVVVFSIG